MRLNSGLILTLIAMLLEANKAEAAFHFMKIEQVIGGVNGDTSAQAVQLRLMAGGQNQVQSSRLIVRDAAGLNPVVLEAMDAPVASGTAGRRVLLVTGNFLKYTNPALTLPTQTATAPNFIMDPIPASYLAAGSLTFEDDFGTIYWRLTWGGTNYTGATTGSTTNDPDGNFGKLSFALPTSGLQAVRYQFLAANDSTSNDLDYLLTTGAAAWLNNASNTVMYTTVAGTPGDYNDDGIADTADYVVWRKMQGTNFNLAGNGDENGTSGGIVDTGDFNYWRQNFGRNYTGSGGDSPTPEPASAILSLVMVLFLSISARRVR
jgi:hypothetical protein